MYKIDREKCVGCGLCVMECPGGTEIKEDGKAEVIDQQKLADCQGEKICPYGAIEEVK